MNSPSFRALIVEDDNSWQQILSEILSDCGLGIDRASELNEALVALKQKTHRLAIIDLSLSPDDHNNYDGLKVIDAVRRLDPNCQTILLTGFATVELAVTALTEYGAFTFLRKENFHRGQFRVLVYRVLASPEQILPQHQISNLSIKGSALSNNVRQTSYGDAEAGKALIVEDDAGWRSIIGELLVDINYQVFPCSSFGEALGYLRREKFSLAVVDLSLSGNIASIWDVKNSSDDLEGYQLLASTRAGGIPTIVVSGVASPEEIKRAYSEQSIFAYLEKQAFDRTTFLRIINEARNIKKIPSGELTSLTEREREVLNQIAQGLTNKEIAENLFITTNTVKRHLKSVFEKLDVHTRSAAAAIAIGEK